MNKKLEQATEELVRELQGRLPELTLDIYYPSRKSADVFMVAPRRDYWDDDHVLDTVDGMGQKQVDTLIKTGYSIHLLMKQPQSAPGMAAPAALREPSPEWDTEQAKEKAQGENKHNAIK